MTASPGAPRSTSAQDVTVNTCTGIAAVSTTELYFTSYASPIAANLIYKTTFSGGVWTALTSVGPASPVWGSVRGLSVDAHASPYVFAAGVQMRYAKSGIAAAVATLSGTTWSSWFNVQPMDTQNNGLTAGNPSIHYNAADGYYYLGVNLTDDGSVSGNANSRLTIYRATDATKAWQLVQSIGSVFSLEAHAVFASGALYAFDNTKVYNGPAAPAPTDLTSDVLAISIREQASAETRFAITLSNKDGQYNAIPNLRDNAQLQLSLGYNGTTIVCHHAYVDALEYRAPPDGNTLTIHCRDYLKFLDQICMIFTPISSQTVSAIATAICHSANVALATIPGTSQFSQVIPCFIILPGETWLSALKRLSDVYDFEITVSSTSGSPQVILTERGAADASTWIYGQETLGIAWQRSSDQPNIVRVVGQSSTSTNLFAEAQDAGNLASSGVHRYRHITDRMCDTAAKCLLKANLALRDDQTQSQSGALTVTLNPAHELTDVITITDARLALTAQKARIMAIDTTVNFQSGEFLQHLQLDLP